MRWMIKRFLIVTFLISLCSCSWIKRDQSDENDAIFGTKDYADSLVSAIAPLWFTGSVDFRLLSSAGRPASHLLYDTKPTIDMENKTLNFVVKTPVASEFKYELNLVSGQRYVSKRFCPQEDVWETFKKEVDKPNYTTGIIPRIMDQIGEPQEIIVFGGENYIQKNYKQNYFDARVIGGVIEQVCPFGGCLKLGEWKSRIKLIGVLVGDKKYKNIESVKDLRKAVDWAYTKAFMQNGGGKNIIAKNPYPAIRIGAELSATQALRYIDKNSILLSNKKLFSMRKTCHKLYNYIWENVGKLSSTEEEALKFRKLALREVYFTKNRSKVKTLFYKHFIKYFRKYHEQYLTCSEYIYPSSVNEDPARHWFFTYLSSIHYIHKLGFTFDCNRTVWTQNPYTISGKRMISLNQTFEGCDARKLDFAFEYAPNYLYNLRSKNLKSYRYIDYDGGPYGTHNKIYSWVKTDPRSFQCSDKFKEIVDTENTFPEDVNWKRRSLQIKFVGGDHL